MVLIDSLLTSLKTLNYAVLKKKPQLKMWKVCNENSIRPLAVDSGIAGMIAN